MASKKKLSPKEKRTKDSLETATHQKQHAVTELFRPSPPAGAKWEVSEWCSRANNWKHVGFALDVAGRQRILSNIRAFGGKSRFLPVRATGSALIRPSSTASTEVTSEATQLLRTKRDMCRSLEFWLHEVAIVRLDVDVKFDQLRVIVCACKSAMLRHNKSLYSKAEGRQPRVR